MSFLDKSLRAQIAVVETVGSVINPCLQTNSNSADVITMFINNRLLQFYSLFIIDQVVNAKMKCLKIII